MSGRSRRRARWSASHLRSRFPSSARKNSTCVSGSLTTGPSARLACFSRYGDAQIDTVENGRYYLSPSVTWKLGDHTTCTLLGRYQRDEGGSTYQFLPALGTLQPSNGRYIENGTFVGKPDYNACDRGQYLAASFFEHRFDNRIALRNRREISNRWFGKACAGVVCGYLIALGASGLFKFYAIAIASGVVVLLPSLVVDRRGKRTPVAG